MNCAFESELVAQLLVRMLRRSRRFMRHKLLPQLIPLRWRFLESFEVGILVGRRNGLLLANGDGPADQTVFFVEIIEDWVDSKDAEWLSGNRVVAIVLRVCHKIN